MIAEFDPAAEQEFIASIRRYLGEAGPLQATDFDNEVKRVVRLLCTLPRIGTPGAPGNTIVPTYSLHYRIEPEVIRVLAVAHHSRRPGYWRQRP